VAQVVEYKAWQALDPELTPVSGWRHGSGGRMLECKAVSSNPVPQKNKNKQESTEKIFLNALILYIL
jgi:hypothetical protein